MTRGNFVIVCGYPAKHYFERGSDSYLSGVMEDIFQFVKSCAYFREDKILGEVIEFWNRPDSRELSTFVDECNLTLGSVGNFCYAYEIDFKKQTIRAWGSTTKWVTAPADWEERGWNCYIGEKKKTYGYTNWVKGKKLVDLKFSNVVLNDKGKLIINKPLLEKIIKE